MESTRRRFCCGNTTVRFERIVADLATIFSIHIRALIGEIQEYINNALYYNIHLFGIKTLERRHVSTLSCGSSLRSLY